MTPFLLSVHRVKHPDVRGVSFTGGTVSGKKVAVACAESLKKVTCELGGKNPVLVFEDCYFEEALNTVLAGGLLNTVQYFLFFLFFSAPFSTYVLSPKKLVVSCVHGARKMCKTIVHFFRCLGERNVNPFFILWTKSRLCVKCPAKRKQKHFFFVDPPVYSPLVTCPPPQLDTHHASTLFRTSTKSRVFPRRQKQKNTGSNLFGRVSYIYPTTHLHEIRRCYGRPNRKYVEFRSRRS